MNKKEIITSIEHLSDLSKILSDLLTKIGLKDVTYLEPNLISALEESPLRIIHHLFYVTMSELGGKVPQVSADLKKYANENSTITVVSSNPKKISSYFQEWIKSNTGKTFGGFWGQIELIGQIDKHLPDYWGHNDFLLKSYEDRFIQIVEKEIELQKVLKLDDKFEKLLNVFIKPKIFIYREDPETKRKQRTRTNMEVFLKKENFFITGEAGTGKSTLIKEVGKLIVNNNHQTSESRTIPILIKASDIQASGYNLVDAIDTILSKEVGKQNLERIYDDYHLKLLFDSIDEFESNVRNTLLSDLNDYLEENEKANFIICTRNYRSLVKDAKISAHQETEISNFDQRQVRQYLDSFFRFDLSKAAKLWESLNDNNILERIPVTPLTISLMSILYEERQYEVPATITDVFDNFNIFLLGRHTIKSNLDFLDINVKERILSSYALDIIKSKNRKKKSSEEFVSFVREFFSKRSITISEDQLPELLSSLTDGTGILYLDDNKMVTFKHDNFMEYYASKEIFKKHNRAELETELISNFTQFNWQNTAVFYAGITKDMPEFLKQLITQIDEYDQLHDCLIGASGLGYLLQSLWMTDSQVRKLGVLKALDLLLIADYRVKELAKSKFHFFDGVKDVDIAFMNLAWFFSHFNSVVVKDPLNLAFEDLYEEIRKLDSTIFSADRKTRLYQLFCIASTLDSGRNADATRLTQLFDEKGILNDPFFVILFEEGSKVLELANGQRLRDENKTSSKRKKYAHAIRFYIDNTAEDLRFTNFEQLQPLKSVEIITEGKTDAMIINHAFSVLTEGKSPYWNITAVEKLNGGGGANSLRKYIENLTEKDWTDEDKKKTVIGVFDNDSKGYQEFNGIQEKYLKDVNACHKKHDRLNLHAIRLPIPPDEIYESYIQDKQQFKFFAIECYFPNDFLVSHNVVKETSIPGVFEVIGNKSEFAAVVERHSAPDLFKGFITLFHFIDEICGRELVYID